MKFVVINEHGKEIEEFDTQRLAEDYCEYMEQFGHDYDIKFSNR